MKQWVSAIFQIELLKALALKKLDATLHDALSLNTQKGEQIDYEH